MFLPDDVGESPRERGVAGGALTDRVRHAVVGRGQLCGFGGEPGDEGGDVPVGRTVRYSETFIFRFADGQIVDLWGVVDVLSQLRQLGHVT
ncbi:ester cyclase [Actinoplanes awajinensis]|uniref:ester cyclase n=1 Tax=Actinoplanes awajinensis TaxID=135946 RepID=UPI00373FCA2A